MYWDFLQQQVIKISMYMICGGMGEPVKLIMGLYKLLMAAGNG